jgi:hypothetical protein
MDGNFLDDLSRIIGKVPGDIQDLIGEMSLDDVYTLMNLVHQGSDDKVKDLLSPMLQKDGTLDKQSTPEKTGKYTSEQMEEISRQGLMMQVKDSNIFESVLDELDEKNISYQLCPGNRIIVRCNTNEQLENLHVISRQVGDMIKAKKIKEQTMDKPKKFDKKSNKIQIPASKPRDTMAQHMALGQAAGAYRPKSTPSRKEVLARKAEKHKGRSFNEGFDPISFWTNGGDAFTVVLEGYGDSVTFDGQSLNTDNQTWEKIQESLDAEGFLSGVDYGVTEMKKSQVKEGVMGMTALPGLRRMMELAGMPTGEIEQVAADPAIPAATDEVPPALPAPDADNMAGDDMEMDADPLTTDHIEDGGMDMDDAAMGDEFDAGIDAGMGSDLGVVAASPAFTLIDDALNSIQQNLPDVKISEYKTLIQRLEDLQVQLQQIGKSYLGD